MSLERIISEKELKKAKFADKIKDNILIGAVSLLALLSEPYTLNNISEAAKARGKSHRTMQISCYTPDYSEVPVPKVGYTPLFKEPDLGNIQIADDDCSVGRIQRALRWRNITQAVESRYNIPRDYLIGMICVESEGDPTQPNSLGDGGLGLIHMQPLMATKYGLRLITKSKKLRDFWQGKRIERAIDMYNGDLKDLIRIDDRFHPIKNIDAAGRMLADSYQRTHSWTKALERYAGRHNYDSKVLSYVNKVHSVKFMGKVRKDFANRNKSKFIRGSPANFDNYFGSFHNLNRNYGLDKYKSFRKRPVHQ